MQLPSNAFFIAVNNACAVKHKHTPGDTPCADCLIQAMQELEYDLVKHMEAQDPKESAKLKKYFEEIN